MSHSSIKKLLNIALLLTLSVVILGAFTRLTDAGLGCPDWPGCYGHMILPSSEHGLSSAQMSYPNTPIVQHKAWTEMVHRYAAGSLGLLILIIAFLTVRTYLKGEHSPVKIAAALIAMLAFQAALGMWTVTMKLLPIVVMGHLLGGMTLLSLLAWYRFSLVEDKTDQKIKPVQNQISSQWFWVGVLIVFAQIGLGGWVSSNYAGLACIGFPMCNGQLLPHLDFTQGFNLLHGVGANHQGGLLNSSARVTIQVVHRLGAVITAGTVIALAVSVLRISSNRLLRRTANVSLLLIVVQFSLGILNVVDLLPLPIAVAHNGVAALLLITMVAMLKLNQNNTNQKTDSPEQLTKENRYATI